MDALQLKAILVLAIENEINMGKTVLTDILS